MTLRARRDTLCYMDVAGMEERMDAIRLKQILGVSLTEQELMCLQIEQNGMACHVCAVPDNEEEL